jgi:hypothetical protein
MEAPEAAGMEFSTVPHILGVPRYLYRTCVTAAGKMAKATLKGDAAAAFEHELWLWFFAGILKQRVQDSRSPGKKDKLRIAEQQRPY